MSFQSKAQEMLIIEDGSQHSDCEHNDFSENVYEDLEVIDNSKFEDSILLELLDVHHDKSFDESLECETTCLEHDDAPCEEESFVLEVFDLPGAPPGTHNPSKEKDEEESEEEVEVEIYEDESVDSSSKGKSDKSKADDAKKPSDKWDWSELSPEDFFVWVKERFGEIPKHSGYDTAGVERAIAYIERLDGEISKAMRMDLDGDLDANLIEEARESLDKGINMLQDRLDAIRSSKKKTKKKKAGEYQIGFTKEAQKLPRITGIVITVPLLISRIARVCINGTVSGGHDIEDLYERQVKFYDLNYREQAELMQHLADMGYIVRQDRGFMPDYDYDVSSSDNMDWAANYTS